MENKNMLRMALKMLANAYESSAESYKFLTEAEKRNDEKCKSIWSKAFHRDYQKMNAYREMISNLFDIDPEKMLTRNDVYELIESL